MTRAANRASRHRITSVGGVLLLTAASLAPHAGRQAVAADPRLSDLKNLRTDRFAFDPPKSAEEWLDRAQKVRRQVRVAAGLWPDPPRPTPRATVHQKVEREGYTVEAISLESFTGFKVTGSLYRPTEPATRPRPVVLSPHGHWSDGRFHRWREDQFAEQLAVGAERDEPSGRRPLQARCVHLARMGCVVFICDMLGYGDCQQMSLLTIHAPSDQTILTDADAWGFYSAQAELRLQGPLGVHAYNLQCALDWLLTLEDIDPRRVAVTGGSGGATQTLVLSALDDRMAVSVPVVMVSTAMQGGCGCENACCLRIGTSNVELAALFAPKPMQIVSADDWTRGFAEDGWPEMQEVYGLLGASDRVSHAPLIQYPHNYNRASRRAMYKCIYNRFSLGDGDAPEEQPFTPLTTSEMSITRSAPAENDGSREAEIRLMRAMDQLSRQSVKKFEPHDAESLAKYQQMIRPALEVLIGGATGTPADVERLDVLTGADDGNARVEGSIRNGEAGVSLPCVCFAPTGAEEIVVVTSDVGKLVVIQADGSPTTLARILLDQGLAVLGVDLFAQGSLAPVDGPLRKAPVAPDQRPVPSLTYGYNRTPVAHRVGDLLAAGRAARQIVPGIRQASLIAVDDSAPYAAVALTLSDQPFDRALVSTGGFRFAYLGDWRDPRFLPGAVKYGDVPGLLAAAAPMPLSIHGESSQAIAIVEQAYASTAAPGGLAILNEATSIDAAIEEFAASRDTAVPH